MDALGTEEGKWAKVAGKRLQGLSGDPVGWVGWWTEVALRCARAGLRQEVVEAVHYVEDCGDAGVRRAKDLGVLKEPGRWLVCALKQALEGKGERMPRMPGKKGEG